MSPALDARPVVPGSGRVRPLSLSEVKITGGFWGDRQMVNAASTIAHCHEWMERLDWVGNFRAAVEGRLPDDRKGVVFTDSDVYKLMEAAAWEHGRSGSTDANERFTALAEVIAPVQEPDGYLNTVFGRPGQPSRYSDLEWGHELYCFGHMLQAAVARARTVGDDLFVDVARRAADHVCDVFGPGGIERVGGHPVIELGLIELARLTGEQRYLDQAALFIERRGRHTLEDIHWGRSYFQDDMPIRDQRAFTGHSVRALYLASAAVDVAVETGDDGLLEAIIGQWEQTVARRTYLTGGMGSHHAGEMYGDDFVLPPDRAYSETCAGVASVMLSWRLLLATGEPRFADLAERTLFNVVATSPAPDGRAFFYANPLHQRRPGAIPDPDAVSNRAASSLREPWFAVSCCPTNVARTFASLAGYLATSDGGGIQIHQYANSGVTTTLDGRRPVGVEVETRYPDDGKVRVRITESGDEPWALSLRVPEWAIAASLVENGERRSVSPGTATVERVFRPGEDLLLDLSLTPRWTVPDPRIDAIRGCVAVERGPIVMCVESVDLPGGAGVDTVEVDPDAGIEDRDGAVTVSGRLVEHDDDRWPYAGTPKAAGSDSAGVPLAPYHSWGNRGPSTMRVWMPVA
ncbi:MAG TPA: beta-L-arabinofuranosidase domain-containing protein [Acidimicrobiia bacterium]|nr:beta-L-arabinofuranosidase domain-containing protein [Acidimicrobiia bacterium]